jgi:uncharacterized membrane protein YhhN
VTPAVFAVAAAGAVAYTTSVAIGKKAGVLKVIPGLALAWGLRGQPLAFPAGMVLSAAGDAFLLDKDRFFLAGLGAFLVAHVAFVAGFASLAPVVPVSVPLAVGLGVVATAALAVIWPGLHGVKRIAVPVYAATLATMAVFAATRGPIGVAAGLLFVVSDALLAINHFRARLPGGDVPVLVTYFGSLLLLATAVR